jgi:hypothetical protein
MFYVWALLLHDRYQYDSLILYKQTWAFVVHVFKFIWRSYKMFYVWALLSHNRYQYDSLILHKQTWAFVVYVFKFI